MKTLTKDDVENFLLSAVIREGKFVEGKWEWKGFLQAEHVREFLEPYIEKDQTKKEKT